MGSEAMPLQPMPALDRSAVRVRAQRAVRLYPGPIGELVSRELLVFEDFGWRMQGNGDSLIGRLLAQIDRDWDTPERDKSPR